MTHESHNLEEPTNEELRLIGRRSALRLLGGAGLAVIAACATEGGATGTTATAGTSTSAGTGSTRRVLAPLTTFGGAGTCVLIPEETEGPYPLDLSGDEAFFRSDISEGRSSVRLHPHFVAGRRERELCTARRSPDRRLAL